MAHQSISGTIKWWMPFFLLSLVACSIGGLLNPEPTLEKPLEAAVLSDTHTRPVFVGRDLVITTAHADPDGIRDVRFFVDGNLISSQNPPFSQTYFKSEHHWTPPKAGAYAVKIVATSHKDGKAPQELGMIVTAVDPTGDTPQQEIASPPSTPTATLQSQIACLNDSGLVQDVTIPDGTTIQPGSRFDKTWRVKNTGTCDWGAGYTFDLVNNAAFGATRLDVPRTAATGEVNLTLPMVAPAQEGTYRSEWRLFDPQGRAFGKIFFVEFKVPQPSCQSPLIRSFVAQPSTISPGGSSTLTWQVDGATSIKLNPAPQISSAANSLLVSPDKSTTYTLEASNGACMATAQVVVTVSSGQSCDGLNINYFNASPQIIKRGERSTLNWDVTGATYVSVSPAPQISSAANSLQVSPEQTTIYTLEARNAVCTLNRQTTVTVQDPQPVTLYDFIANAPSASWQAGGQYLPWPGSPADYAGYARWLSGPTLQNGAYFFRALEIHPTGAGSVQGRYPINVSGGVQPTDEIRLEMGYLQGADYSSGATYSLKFEPSGNAPVIIGALTLDPNGALTTMTLPLSGVPAGQQGTFILQVDRGPYPNEDVAVWTDIRLVRP